MHDSGDLQSQYKFNELTFLNKIFVRAVNLLVKERRYDLKYCATAVVFHTPPARQLCGTMANGDILTIFDA